MKSNVNCGVCGKSLIYSADPKTFTCVFCGESSSANIYCPDGHYICDQCHSKESLTILRQIAAESKSKSPAEIFELVVSHPSVPMHGPEHHSIIPAAIIIAARNAGFPVADNAIEQAITRGSKVPGGWCGFHGACGAAIGVGTAVSIMAKATPLTGRERSLALEATSRALANMIDDQPRCCKRAGRRAMEAGIDFINEKFNLVLEKSPHIKCTYSSRNRECAGNDCAYFNTKE